jgi:hypothetical protein
MNSEPIILRMTKNEADRIAYVLMSALRTTTMMESERAATMIAVNTLFEQLAYDKIRTDKHGNRTEKK